MLYSLLITALLMGAGGLLHCGAMCAAPCAAALPGGVPLAALLGRTLGYALLGALAAGAMGVLAAWSRWAVMLQPLWVMLLAAVVLLGAWMAINGALPDRVEAQGLRGYRRLKSWVDERPQLSGHAVSRRAWPLFLGMAWAALPCGLLYGAVTVAALAGSPGGGALVMAVFSLPGALALWWLPRRLSPWRAQRGREGASGARGVQGTLAVAPLAWQPVRWAAQGTDLSPTRFADTSPGDASAGPATAQDALTLSPTLASWRLGASWSSWPAWRARMADPRWAIRLSGVMLGLAAGWALAQRLQAQWSAWCA